MNRYLFCLLMLLSPSAFAAETALMNRGGLTNWLYTPTAQPDAAKTYWLVLGVHGAGGNGKGAAGASGWAKEFDDVVVLGPSFAQPKLPPNAPRPSGMPRDIFQMSGPAHEEKLHGLIAEIGKTWKLHPKIILHGFSAGAQFAHRYAFRHPELVAAVSAHSGGSWAQIEGEDRINPAAKHIPFVVSCGEDDKGTGGPPGTPPRIDGAHRFAENLRSLGFSVEFKTWPGVGHAVSPGVMPMARALLEQVRSPVLPAAAWAKLPAHPRLFADAARWAVLKEQIAKDDVSRQIFSVVRDAAGRVLDQPPVSYVDKGAFWHGPMRQAQGRILALAMTYRLTGEVRFLERAKVEMQTLADLPAWYPQHFLDTAEGALGMAVGLDWLHDALTPEERDHFEMALIEKGLRASMEDEEKKTWIIGSNNWTAVCHGGLVIGALSVAEREPALARRIVERALKNLPRYAELYVPAGAYSEGPDYWAYGTTFYALMAEALRTSFGTTCGLERAPGFLQTASYTLQMTAPSGQLYNFADNGSGLGYEPIMFWFARELRRQDLIQRELTNLGSLTAAITSGAPRDDASRMLPLALIWRDPTLIATQVPERPLNWWSEGGSQPQAVLRSAWNDPRATFVGIKAGRADDSHAHMDIGSFILEADGVRWAVDLGRESYPHARANGLAADLFKTTQASKRWSIFRCGPESHNLLRFGDALQIVDAKAEIRPLPPVEAATGFLVDLSPVVRGQVARAERRIRLRADRSVIIADEWTTGATATDVTWQWLTYAQVTVTNDGAILRQQGETLRLRITEGAGTKVEVEDVSAPRHAWDSPNPGLSRILIHLHTPPDSTGRLSVLAEPGRPATNP
jgi:predicted esterase